MPILLWGVLLVLFFNKREEKVKQTKEKDEKKKVNFVRDWIPNTFLFLSFFFDSVSSFDLQDSRGGIIRCLPYEIFTLAFSIDRNMEYTFGCFQGFWIYTYIHYLPSSASFRLVLVFK